jgi:hypothetical protein
MDSGRGSGAANKGFIDIEGQIEEKVATVTIAAVLPGAFVFSGSRS